MKTRSSRFTRSEAQAASWLVRRDRGLSAEEQAEFEYWCTADPRHAAAVANLDAVWAAFDRPAETARVDSFRAELRALEHRDRRRWRAAGVAIGLAAACVAVVIALQWPADREAATLVAGAKVRVTEPQRQRLPDGSLVEFNHGTEISVAFDANSRVVVLRNGEAHFSVVKNPNAPFIVEAGAVKIRAVGTAFAVQYGSAEIEVLVTEGSVSVTPSPAEPAGLPVAGRSGPPPADPPGAPLVAAGQRATVTLGAQKSAPLVRSLSVSELNERLSWRLPRLDFSETTIAEAIRMFRHYSRVPLHAGDEAVAAMRVTGVFRSDNVEGFVRGLEATLGVKVEHRGDGTIVLRAKD